MREEEQVNPILRMLRRHKNQSDEYSFSLGGDQRNRLYRNNGDGTFTEVGYLEGADCSEDGYIVAPMDIDNNGTQDWSLEILTQRLVTVMTLSSCLKTPPLQMRWKFSSPVLAHHLVHA